MYENNTINRTAQHHDDLKQLIYHFKNERSFMYKQFSSDEQSMSLHEILRLAEWDHREEVLTSLFYLYSTMLLLVEAYKKYRSE